MKARASFAFAPTVSAGAVGVADGDPLGDAVGDALGEPVGLGDVDLSSAVNAGRFFALGLAVGAGVEFGCAGSVTPTPGSAVGLALGFVGAAAVAHGPGAALLHATVRKRS